MSKSLKRRQQTKRLRERWFRLLSRLDPDRNLECISFGRVFSQDPFDCGRPDCLLCSREKVLHRKAKRVRLRVEERIALTDLLNENETETD